MTNIGPVHNREYNLGLDAEERVAVGEVPGRIHFLGEHGEDGARLLLSGALDRCVRTAANLRKDGSIRFFAPDIGERKRTTMLSLKFRKEDRWANLVKAAIMVFMKINPNLEGFNFTVTGNIPMGLGLASSEAVELSAAIALRKLIKPSMSDPELIRRLIEAKTELFRRRYSSVDYLAMLRAKKDQFVIIDEATGETERVKSPFSKHKLYLTESRVPRIGVESELRMRQEDLKDGLKRLQAKEEGTGFKDYTVDDLKEATGRFPEDTRRRSLHVVLERKRVWDAKEAMRRGDTNSLGRIFYHSHESLRDLFEVSCPEIDWLVKRCQENECAAGSRMIGPGFGGCTFVFMMEAGLEVYKGKMGDYERIFGFHPKIFETGMAGGARLFTE